MRPSVRALITDIALVVVFASVLFYVGLAFPAYHAELRLAYAGLILASGVLVTRGISRIIMREFRYELGKEAPVISNLVAVTGYIVSAFAAATFVSFSPEALLAGAAFSGLILGLALQPTLGSLFAGILILVSGAVRPGSQVRILSWHIPFQAATMPGYKYFSPDSIYAGYIGQVREVGLFFTSIITEEGQMMKIPNTILATDAAILSYTEGEFVFNVRYEFPNKFDPEMVLRRAKMALADFPLISVFINEQSDKDYFIVKAVLNAKEKDHALIKSKILTRFIQLHRELAESHELIP